MPRTNHGARAPPALPTPTLLRRPIQAAAVTGGRRAGLAAAGVIGLVGVAAVRVWGAVQGGGPAAVALDVGALAGLGLGWAALSGPRAGGPLRALSVPLAVALGVLALTAAAGLLDRGALDPKTALPTAPATAAWGAVVGLAHAALAVVLLAWLRPLVLHRRRRAVVWAWGALAALVGGAALTVAGRPLATYAPSAMAPFLVALVVVGAGLALRQRWVGALTSGQRLGAAGLALALAAALAGLVTVQATGPAQVAVGDGTGAIGSVAYASLLSRSLHVAALLVVGWGGLYAATAALVLLLGLSSGDSQGQRVGERRALRSLADVSGRLLDRAALADAVARGPVEAGLADAAWLALTDPARGVLTPAVVAAQGIEVGAAALAADVEALYRAALAQDGPLVLGRAEADHRVHARPGDGVASLVAIPLGSPGAGPGGATRGVLVATRAASEAFEPDDLAALDTFAGQVSLSLSHADLFADALERDRLASELALAREVQRRLLPQALPEIDGLELAAAERPAREVGGDYYDAVRLGPDCVGLIVADVSGKGAAAAFYMAEMKGVFQAGSRLTRSPGELLAGANDALSLGRGVFVSAAYAVVDAEAGTLALARAGHTPAVLVRDPRAPRRRALAAPRRRARDRARPPRRPVPPDAHRADRPPGAGRHRGPLHRRAGRGPRRGGPGVRLRPAGGVRRGPARRVGVGPPRPAARRAPGVVGPRRPRRRHDVRGRPVDRPARRRAARPRRPPGRRARHRVPRLPPLLASP